MSYEAEGYGALRALRKLAAVAVDLIWPPQSLLSDATVDAPGRIEAELWRELRFLGPPWCARCGFPFEAEAPEDAVCGACALHAFAFQSARAALAYDDHARRLVLDLKRRGRRDGLATFATWMHAAAGGLVDGADALVPVPLHWTRRAQRTFNQAEWLAAALARASARPLAPTLLVRRHMRKSQAGLGPAQRRRNAAGLYLVPERKRAEVAGKRILLVDDVFTTGATLDACARALRRAGAARVDAIALARVVRPVGVAI